MSRGVYEPISLGFNCEVKFQLSRAIARHSAAYASAEDVRRAFAIDYGSGHFRRHLFDWQVTPFPALIAWLEADFIGVYEREDFAWSDDAGAVVHVVHHTEHPHDFNGARSPGEIEAAYAGARGRFEYLADRFRRHLLEPGRFLYVFTEIQAEDQAERLLGLLNADAAGRDVHILLVDKPGCDADLSGLEGRVTKAWREIDSGKAAEHAWEGCDEAWDRILAPFALRRGGEPLAGLQGLDTRAGVQ